MRNANWLVVVIGKFGQLGSWPLPKDEALIRYDKFRAVLRPGQRIELWNPANEDAPEKRFARPALVVVRPAVRIERGGTVVELEHEVLAEVA